MNVPLSSAEPTAPNYTRYYLIAGGVAAVAVIAYLVFGGGGAPVRDAETKLRPDDPLRIARESLNRESDLTTCREAVTQFNLMLSRPKSTDAASPTIAPVPDWIRERFELKDDEWAEITSESFTLLDGHYLETAFLFRDAAASFTRDGVLDYAPPLRRAALAFDWAVRQVRLPDGRDSDADPLPLDFILRRGRGTAIERALVFVSLLQQLDLPGCLINLREPLATGFHVWACGVLIDQDIYLFDPGMGIPLPGPTGAGIATLAEVQTKPDLLKQLAADGYDVTAEQAQRARIYLAPSLSALAPRMRYLEKRLQDQDVAAPVVSVRLGVDAKELFKQWADAKAHAGLKDSPPVQAWPAAVRCQRTTLPTQEGGADRRRERGQLSIWDELRRTIVPAQYFPRIFKPEMVTMIERMGQRFGTPFFSLAFEPHQPRDALLRGRFDDASRSLTALRTEKLANVEQLEANPELPRHAAEAVMAIVDAQGAYMRAQSRHEPDADALRVNLEITQKERQGLVDAYIDGCAAVPLSQEASYQLALTKHEQAVRMQLRVEFPSPKNAGAEAEAEEARRAWLNASDWWTTYLSKYAATSTAPAARLQAAHARIMLGERDAALDLLRDHSNLTDLEKVGRAILSRQLAKK